MHNVQCSSAWKPKTNHYSDLASSKADERTCFFSLAWSWLFAKNMMKGHAFFLLRDLGYLPRTIPVDSSWRVLKTESAPPDCYDAKTDNNWIKYTNLYSDPQTNVWLSILNWPVARRSFTTNSFKLGFGYLFSSCFPLKSGWMFPSCFTLKFG